MVDLIEKIPGFCYPAAVSTAVLGASIFSRHEITNRTEKQAAARLAA
jgi:hypothetical protein